MFKKTIIISLVLAAVILISAGTVFVGQIWRLDALSANKPIDKIGVATQCFKSDGDYRGISEIKKIDPNNVYDPDRYQLFKNNKYKFYYPKNWTIKKDNEVIIFTLPATVRVYLGINQPKDKANFIRDYDSCINKCFFNVSSEDDFVALSNDEAFCSLNNTKDNLERIISGNYVEYLRSGPTPPGGTSSFILTKFINNDLITIRIGSDDLQFLPVYQKLYREKNYSSLTENDKRRLKEELDNLINDSLVIIESFVFVK